MQIKDKLADKGQYKVSKSYGGSSGGFKRQEKMTDIEAMKVREIFGEFVVNRGAQYSDGMSLHVPLKEDVPLCNRISSGPNKSGFDTKSEAVFPHGYVKDSSYKYCLHCTRILRENVFLFGSSTGEN